MSFVHYHVHSQYSSLDGLSTTKEIAQRCVDLGFPACGLSDHGCVTGHLDFDRDMRAAGLTPIFAAEAYHGLHPEGHKFKRNERDQAHFLVGALTDRGLTNLWSLTDASAHNFYYVPRVDWDLLRSHREGLFATSACVQGLVVKELREGVYDSLNGYLDIFGDDFFIELHTYPTEDQAEINHGLISIAEERGIPTLIACDAHYACNDQYDIHDAYIAKQTGQTINTPVQDRKMWHPKSLYIQSVEEIRENLNYLPGSIVEEAINNSLDLVERIDAHLPETRRHLPVFVPADCPWIENKEKNAATLFIDLVEEGLYSRYGEPGDEVWERAEQEIKVFLDAGLEHYFLQTYDFMQYCKAEGIKTGPGRGSSSGSLVSYALGITQVDPLRYGLIFERFYNPGREEGLPDIDTDFPTGERGKVIDYLKRRWGENNVRQIGTTVRMKPKAACDKTYQVCNVSFDENEQLKAIIKETPDIEILGMDTIGWSKEVDPGKVIYVWESVGDKIEAWLDHKSPSDQKRLRKWIDVVSHVCGRVSTYGIHPSGVVVSDSDLTKELPGRWNTHAQMVCTSFDMSEVDARGYVKQDILGLRNLDTLIEWERLTGWEVDWNEIQDMDFTEDFWEHLDDGFSIGVFQIERGYARQLCKQLKPRSIADLAAIVALNRPGPIRSGVPDSYIARKNDEESITYDHPILEDILGWTQGHILYQEQIIGFFTKLGYNLSDADAVRKILGKKRPEQLDALLHGKGEWKGKGYLEIAEPQMGEAALKVWKKIEEFAKYSFNFSHAIGYAILGVGTLYAKWRDPAAFYLALLRTNEKPDNVTYYISEARRKGISILPPDIEHSDVQMSLSKVGIVCGFADVHGIGSGSAQYLTELRESYDLTSPDKLFEALSIEGEKWKKADKETRGQSPRQKFRANLIAALENAGAWDNHEPRDITSAKRQKLEEEYLGVVLSDHSADDLEKAIQDESLNDYDDLDLNGLATLPGIVTAIRPTKTKAEGKAMGIVTIQYKGDEVEFAVFPTQWTRLKSLWKERTPGIFTVQKTDRGYNLTQARKIW